MKSLMDRTTTDVRGRKIEETRDEKVGKVKARTSASVASAIFVPDNGSGTFVPRSPPGSTDRGDHRSPDAGAGRKTDGGKIGRTYAHSTH